MTHPPVRDDGRIDVTVTYLQMTAPPQHPPRSAPAGMKLALMRAEKPTVSFYRYLYNTVGEPWLWGDRRRLNDEALARIITDERVEIYVLYVAGVPAGFAELDRRVAGEIELAYFGLIPDFLGRGLGPYLLDQVIAIAWSHQTKALVRAHVHPRSSQGRGYLSAGGLRPLSSGDTKRARPQGRRGDLTGELER